MPNPRLYPKTSTYDLTRTQPGQAPFNYEVPSPLSQAVSRRFVEQEQADAKAKDMKLSPLDRAIAGLEAVGMAGTMAFESIQQLPQLMKGEDAYAQAIAKRMYTPRHLPEKSKEYVGNAMDVVDKLQTDYKLPPIMPELAGFGPLAEAAKAQAAQGVARKALKVGTAVERALDKPVTDVMNRGGFGAQMLGSFSTNPARVIYSAADRAAANLKRNKGTGAEFMTELKKTPGVKPAEIEHRNLQEIADMPKMSKEQFMAELKKRPPVQISETVLPEGTTAKKGELAEAYYNKDYYDLSLDQREYIDKLLARYGKDAQGQDYHLPGGENYREVLMQLPSFGLSKMDDLMAAEAASRRNPGNPLLAQNVERLKAEKASYGDQYIHQHFGAENPNIVAHVRVQDRKGPNGEKVLHVEEIQSDWHQAGREKGYRGEQKKTDWDDPEYVAARNRSAELNNEFNRNSHRPDRQAVIQPLMEEASRLERSFIDRNNQIGNLVPDAPFKKNWHELATNRLLDYATKNGYDSIAFTPGKEQINRYEDALRKNLDRLDYEPYKDEKTGKTLYELSGHKGDKQVFTKEDVTPEELKELIGKDMLAKIEAGEGRSLAEESPLRPNWMRLEGDNISIGGEGMKGFYDQMIPNYLDKVGKKYGVKTELGGQQLPGAPIDSMEVYGYPRGEEYVSGQITWPEMVEANPELANKFQKSLHNFPITEEMRKDITENGLPLYSHGGAVTISDDPAVMQREMQDKHFAGGGLLRKAMRLSAHDAEAVMPSARRAMRFAEPAPKTMNVIKEKGGNWLSGTGVNALKPLKRNETAAKSLEEMRNVYPPEVLETLSPETRGTVTRAFPHLEKEVALNNWVDRNLTNYVKKEMATPEDPVRKLAEEGITHMPANEIDFHTQWIPEDLALSRMKAGFPSEGVGKSNTAKGWEAITDSYIHSAPAGEYTKPLTDSEVRRGFKSVVDDNPWLTNLDPETHVGYLKNQESLSKDLGFDHIMDVLRQDLASGRIRPEQLNKVSMEQAVRRTYEFDQEQARKMAEAQIKATEGMPVHKEYPEGYKWIELAPAKEKKVYTAETLPEGFTLEKNADGFYNVRNFNVGMTPTTDSYSRNPEESIKKFNEWVKTKNHDLELQRALTYEGDTMGHCVGGYCPDVIEGKSRIYSLRDQRGEPHVTIEVQPMRGSELGRYAADLPEGEDVAAMKNPPNRIVQIKGKGNARPIEKYDPYTQDFVRSGEWSDVGDLKNTGLIDTQKLLHESVRQKYSEHGIPNPRYMTAEEFDNLPNPNMLQGIEKLPPEGEGMKAGGVVSISDNPDTMMMEVEDQKLAGGGLVKRVLAIKNPVERAAQATELLARMAAKNAEYDADTHRALLKAQSGKRALPEVIPRAKPKTKEDIRPYAQKTADQLNAAREGKFLRDDPNGPSENAAEKSKKLWDMEQQLVHNITPLGKQLDPIQAAKIEEQMGMLKLGISGDTSISDQVLHQAGPYKLLNPSTQEGGALFGLRQRQDPAAWASNVPVLSNLQKDVNDFSRAYGDVPVLGQYNSMGRGGTNFAEHFAEANLNAIAGSNMTDAQKAAVNDLFRAGNAKSGPHPDFPGIEDPAGADFYLQLYPELRKHINAIMLKPDITSKYGLPDGRVLLHAITEPELRDMPLLTSGKAQYELVPGVDPKNLPLSEHATYSHNLPRKRDAPVTQTPFPIPAELEFSDATEYAKPRYDPSDMTRVLQTASPRQIIDQQHIDEMKMYEELMREYAPDSEKKKDGGLITVKRKLTLPAVEKA